MTYDLRRASSTTGVLGSGQTRRGLLGAAGIGIGAAALAACTGGDETAPLGGAALSKELAGEKKKVIWALAALDPWNIPVDIGFIEATQMLGWDYQKVGVPISQYSPENVVNVINRAAQSRPDVLVTPAWVPGVAEAAAKAQEEGILVMFNNANNIPDQSEELGIAFIGANDYNGGRALAPVLHKAMVDAGKSDGVVIGGLSFAGNENLEARLRGVDDGLNELNESEGTSFEFERFIDEGPDVGPARTAYAAKIRQYGLDGVAGAVTNMDVTALVGAIQEAGGEAGQVPVGSWNLLEATIDGIKGGWVTGVVDVQDYSTGFLPVWMAWQYFERGQKPRDYDSGGAIVTSADIDAVGKREENLRKKGEEYNVKVG